MKIHWPSFLVGWALALLAMCALEIVCHYVKMANDPLLHPIARKG